ncbi:MAG: hypothetical protein EAZ32_01420 [Cytophagia bacterium]|nr:MAG: hypothetical protein EAZ46_00785 [Runella sp.]TAG22915.1 MAG: hypothetical protein EAZ38_03895 [Cytophagales bacterium]TAG41970.1 MAG: hypothetical protein EAZ32_01420 [Cytophagia bacterium]TAG51730.1 MAG: hypothetical protein EAZ29_08980 [Runella slithyformis]TAG75330.1 MAG: hypothetical protein EAZ26_00745 [Runella slithyformis]
MKKDISFEPVQGVNVAITRQINELNQAEWHVCLINKTNQTLTNVFVTSHGYSEKGENQQKTSTLRHYFTEIAPNSSVVVEPIMPQLFRLYNEYLVSYFLDTVIFDKKFIFVPDSIVEVNLVPIAELNLVGILHE